MGKTLLGNAGSPGGSWALAKRGEGERATGRRRFARHLRGVEPARRGATCLGEGRLFSGFRRWAQARNTAYDPIQMGSFGAMVQPPARNGGGGAVFATGVAGG